MKNFIIGLLLAVSVSAQAQGNLSEYIRAIKPESFQELMQWVMDPRFTEELKQRPELGSKIVNAAMQWETLSDDDLNTWRQCLDYLKKSGVKINPTGKEGDEHTLMFASSHVNWRFEEDLDHYKLHAAVLAIGGKTESKFKGEQGFLSTVLAEMSADHPLINVYVADFAKWEIPRQRAWLYKQLEDKAGDDEILSTIFGRLLDGQAFDVNMRSKSNKESLFDVAFAKGYFSLATLLLDKGFNVNQRCFECQGQTALHDVVANKEFHNDERIYDLIVKMAESGGDADLRDLKGETPIHKAINLKCEICFRAFMDERVKFNYQMPTLKGANYRFLVERNWKNPDMLEILVERTGLKPPPTKKELKQAQKEQKKGKTKKKKKKK